MREIKSYEFRFIGTEQDKKLLLKILNKEKEDASKGERFNIDFYIRQIENAREAEK